MSSKELRGHKVPAYAAAPAQDGMRIVNGSDDYTVRVSRIGRSKKDLVETARAWLPRELAEQERRRFHLSAE
jgi:hypothetical protein